MKKSFAIAMSLVFLFTASLAWGDATIVTTVKSGGFKGMGAAESSQTRQYRGEMMTETSTSQFTGAVLSFLTSASETTRITRVDKGVYWDVNVKDKSYKEGPIVPLQLEKETAKRQGEKPRTRVTKSEFNVTKTGASETINGFPCQEYIVSWLLETENMDTKEKARYVMENHVWTTPLTSVIQKAQAEEQRFTRALMKKIGDISPREAQTMGMAIMGSLVNAPEDDIKKGMIRVKNEMAKMKGYPIRTVVGWSMEGDKGQGDDKARKSPSSDEPGSIAGVGGMLSGVMGNLGLGKSGGGKAEDKSGPMFTSTIEVKSIAADAVPDKAFEIPGGFKKKSD